MKRTSALVPAALLALVAGGIDALTYVRFHLFGANMTGNTVLLGIACAGGEFSKIGSVAAPIGAFAFGCFVSQLWRGRSVAIPLVAEAAVVVIASAFASGAGRSSLAAIAFAMGLQNTAIASFGGVKANTSFVTGDYGRLATSLANVVGRRGKPEDVRTIATMATILLAYVSGAFGATIARRGASFALIGDALAVVVLVVAVIAARRAAPLT